MSVLAVVGAVVIVAGFIAAVTLVAASVRFFLDGENR